MIERSLAADRPGALHSLFARVPDQRLVQLAKRGSNPAFATIYRRHHQELYRYCRSLLGNDDDAGDALQNTMLCALRGLEGEQREIALRPWLFRIAHNESISLMRSRSRSALLAPEDINRAGGADDVEARERFAALISDLGQLSSHQRSALMMRELSGLEFSEIGAALQTSPEAAKQAVYQARIALSELAEGRDMSCDEIRRKVSVEDRRRLRGRRIRAHLRGCPDCREFERQIRDRTRTLAGFAPTLGVPGATAVLEGVLGGSAGAGGGTASLFGAAAGAKAAATAAAALALGAGVYVADRPDAQRSTDAAGAAGSAGPAAGEPRGDLSTPHGATTEGRISAVGVSAAGDGNAGTAGGGSAVENGSSPAGGAGGAAGGAAEAGGPADASSASGSAPASQAGSDVPTGDADAPQAGTPPGQGGTPPGQGGTPPSQGGTPPGQGGTPPSQGGTPPGQGGTPPGQGGTPPGQGGTPPGQAGTPPGHGGVPPGQGGIPPGQAGSPPGQGGTPPGQAGSPPGQSGAAPGQSGFAPGHGGTPPGQGGTPPGQAGS